LDSTYYGSSNPDHQAEANMQRCKRKLGGGFLIGGLLAVLLGLWPSGAGAATYTFLPEADAFVVQANPDDNYGNDWLLRVGTYDYDATKFRRSFLRFNLSGTPDSQKITQATLTLFIQGGASADFTIDARHVPTDDWLAGGITWNHQPDSGNTLDNQAVYATTGNPGAYGTRVTWNLLAQTGQWNWQADLGDDHLSLVLRLPTESTTTAKFLSFRSADNDVYMPEIRPVLNITTAPVPLPSGLLLFGSGLLGLVGLRRFRQR
jgi:hypothetical protein